jgi:thiol peroxidase
VERKGIVTVKGNPVTLIGAEIKVGDKAPDFSVVDGDLKEVRLRDFGGKTKVISVSASIDTPVCDMQARRFNQEAALLPRDVVILNITMDLPFAVSRFCTTAGIDKVQAFSDHRDASFGNAFGVLIKELRLLARSIFIIDKDDVVRYIEIVPELTNHPDYDKALSAVNKLL